MTEPDRDTPETAADEPTPRPRLSWKLDGGIALGLVLLLMLVLLPTTHHYGMTYDEGWYGGTAIRAREWVGYLFSNPARALSREVVLKQWSASGVGEGGTKMEEQQPGAPKLIDGVLGYWVSMITGARPEERSGTALFTAGCVAALYLVLASVWGRGAGIFAVFALVSMPRVFVHAHLAALDVPVMATSFVSVALMFAAVARRSTWLAVLSGLAWGIAMACKINAVFVPMILAAWILWLHRDFALRAALSLVGGGIVSFFLSWPWLWYDTIPHLSRYFAFHLRHYQVGVSYFGHISGQQPWHYPTVMTIITTPPVTLLLGIAGAVIAVSHLRKPKADEGDGMVPWQRSLSALLLIGAVLSIGFNSLSSAPKYGGVRLFMPFFVYLAALAGVAFHAISERIARALPEALGGSLTPVRVRVLLAVLVLVPAVRATLDTHPYQMSYYNAFIGGLPGAAERGMEATYWGDTYGAAIKLFFDALGPDDIVWVDLPGCEWIARTTLPLGFRPDQLCSGGVPPPEATWAVVQNKVTELRPESKALIAAGPPAATISLHGVVLSYVFDQAGVQRGLALLEKLEPGEEASIGD